MDFIGIRKEICFATVFASIPICTLTTQGQSCEENTAPQENKTPTKSSIAKTSSKLSFINRFSRKKHKMNGSNSGTPGEKYRGETPSAPMDAQVQNSIA